MPKPNQQNSKATVGVEVPEEAVRKPFEEGFAPDTTMDSLHKPRGARIECDGCEQCRECLPVGDEVLCAECILARLTDHAQAGEKVSATDEMVEAAARSYFAVVRVVSTNAWDDQPETVKVVYRQDARAILAAALPHIEQAIRNEEREKVLGEVRAAGKLDEVRDVAREAVAREIDDGCGCDQCLATVAVEAALASLPLDAMEEPPEDEEKTETCRCCKGHGYVDRIGDDTECRACGGTGEVEAMDDTLVAQNLPEPCPRCQPPDSLDREGEAICDQCGAENASGHWCTDQLAPKEEVGEELPSLVGQIREEVGYQEAYSPEDEDRESLCAYRDALEERLEAMAKRKDQS